MNWHNLLYREIRLPGDSSRVLRAFVRFWDWLFSWRSRRAGLFATLALATLVVLFYAIENWRGRYAWKKYRTAAERNGVQLDFNAFIPPPVPDEQNFAMTPLLVPLFDYESGTRPILWRDTNGWQRVMRISAYRRSAREPSVTLGDWTLGQRIDLDQWQRYYRNELNETNHARVLKGRVAKPPALLPEDIFPSTPQRQSPSEDVLLALTKYDNEMREIELASQRPYSRFPIHYSDGFATPLAHLAKLRAFAMMFQLRAAAALAATNADAAFADLQTIFRLTDALKGEPFVISELVRVKLHEQALHTLWEGMCDHRWSEAQLADIQRQVASLDVETEFIRAFRAMAAFENLNTEQILQSREGYVREWANMFPRNPPIFEFYVRFAPAGWFYQNELVQNRRIDGIVASLEKSKASGVFEPIPLRPADRTKVYELLVDFPGSFLTNVLTAFPRSRVHLKLAEVACALERFHLAHRAYPQTLGEVTPQFIARLPNDFMDGQPLRYRRIEDHKFVLYSVGVNRKDDGGAFPAKEDTATGDWVWEIR